MKLSFRHQNGVRWVRAASVAACALVIATSSARAQLLNRSVLIKNARILTMAGEPIEGGGILIKGDRITAIGQDIKAPMFCKVFDASGMTATPGLIDAWSALGRLGHGIKPDPTASAWDAFDSYDRAALREALSFGVTTVFVAPGGGPGINGRGAIVRLLPGKGGAAGELVTDEGSVSINLGSDQSSVARLKTFYGVRQAFKAALAYRKSLEDYEEDLEEYLEKLKERKEKEASADDEKDGDKKKKTDKDSEKSEKESQDEQEAKPEKNGRAKALGFKWTGDGLLGREKKDKKSGEGKNGSKDKDDEEEDEEEEELTKPTKPDRDPGNEVLLNAIDHELIVRIEAHRSADLLNALELAEEFGLDVVLEGATDSALVVEALAEAEVPVVLGPPIHPMAFEDNDRRRFDPNTAAKLTEASLPWTVGSGGANPQAARFVGLFAQMIAGHGPENGHWMATVTSRAADLLGLKRSGRLKAGMRADIVLWSSDPGDPGSSAQRVYVGGRLAFKAKPRKPKGGVR